MDTLDNIKQFWLLNNQQDTDNNNLNKESMKRIIEPQIKKEQRYIKEYFWAFAFWQILVYAVLTHFIVRYWGDWQFIFCCVTGVLMFIPYSITFHKSLSCWHRPANAPDAPLRNIHGDLKAQIKQVSIYFQFKKRFDLVGIPVICGVLAVIMMKVTPVPHTFLGGLITFGIVFFAFARTTHVQNKNNFELPLARLRLLLSDIEDLNEE
ncbi:MAG TPA: hypothetical protein VHA56_14485 [Mucilaginibacter sp.]|nr:hypothetical protein [Mucilaginibacter sp.]